MRQFSSIRPIDRFSHSGREWILLRWQWRSTLHSPKLQHYRSRKIRLFCIIFRTLVMRMLPLYRDAVVIFCSTSRRSKMLIMFKLDFVIFLDVQLQEMGVFSCIFSLCNMEAFSVRSNRGKYGVFPNSVHPIVKLLKDMNISKRISRSSVCPIW